MMQTSHKELVERGQSVFTKRVSFMKLLQDIAEQFYVERADFTVGRSLGDDFAAHLTTSYPMMARRDLGNSFSGMLRPTGAEWFEMATAQDIKSRDAKAWLEWATGTQKRAMYDRRSQFVRATKEGDHDFAAFGQAVLSVNVNKNRDGLLFRNWHIRDVAWCENEEGVIDTVFRKWKPQIRVLNELFKGNIAPQLLRRMQKDPYAEVEVMHIEIPSGSMETKFRNPYVSLYIDTENHYCMEEIGIWDMTYVIPRWQTVSGSQYAYSPATVCALPDARLIQAMTLTLLEAGEKAVNPPMIAVQEAIRSDAALYAGGITWVDAAYDERLGEVMRPLNIDKSGLPLGIELHDKVHEAIKEAFYLNKLSLPIMAGDMTATEVSQRVQEYIRQALPLFEPMESEYNGALCERAFEVLLRNGAFGAPETIPDELRGQEIQFRFESPLQEAGERKKAQTFVEATQILGAAAQIDPQALMVFNVKRALRDALGGTGAPAEWTNSEEEVEASIEAQAQQAQMQNLMATVGQGAQVAEQVGRAQQALAA